MRRIVLGTAQFGSKYGIANNQSKVTRDEANKIISFASSCGIAELDTAANYDGSERVLGEIGVGRWRIVSKLPAVPSDVSDVFQWMLTTVDNSLDRLRVSSLYGILLHEPKQLFSIKGSEIYESLCKLKERGLAGKVGISVYEPEELESLVSHYDFDIAQIPVNILDRRFTKSDLLRRLNAKGLLIYARSVFLQGLLLMDSSARPGKFDRWAKLWNDWDVWLHETGLSPLKVCIRYVRQLPEIAKIIVGVDSRRQLEQIEISVDGSLPSIPLSLDASDEKLIDPRTWSDLEGN